jgi:uncharacterized membrane protein YhaH (DUF805 family)
MNFITAIKLCFIRYAQFSGRASRSEFWFFVLFGILGSWIAIIIDTMILNYSWEKDGPVYLIFQIIILIPSIAVGARRLHDLNKSGWWQLLVFTIIGLIPLIYWWSKIGENKRNNHGIAIKLKR